MLICIPHDMDLRSMNGVCGVCVCVRASQSEPRSTGGGFVNIAQIVAIDE